MYTEVYYNLYYEFKQYNDITVIKHTLLNKTKAVCSVFVESLKYMLPRVCTGLKSIQTIFSGICYKLLSMAYFRNVPVNSDDAICLTYLTYNLICQNSTKGSTKGQSVLKITFPLLEMVFLDLYPIAGVPSHWQSVFSGSSVMSSRREPTIVW